MVPSHIVFHCQSRDESVWCYRRSTLQASMTIKDELINRAFVNEKGGGLACIKRAHDTK